MRCLPLLALLGCPAPEEKPAEDEYTPAPYIFDEEAPPVADLDVADLEVAIESAVGMVRTLSATPIFPAYHQAMSGAEATCPSYYDYQGSQYWYDQCDATGGTSFSGYSFYVLYDDYDDGSGGAPYDGEAVYGVAEIVTPEGYTFAAGGSSYALVQLNDGYTVYSTGVQGAFAWDGPGAEGTWLADGIAPDVAMYAVAATQGNYLQVDGGLSGIGGELDTVVFDAVVLYDEGLGSTCGSEPGGVISVRDAAGNWYDVVFDGPTEWGAESDAALCDGCGAAYFRGEHLGDVCADFSSLTGFTGTPW